MTLGPPLWGTGTWAVNSWVDGAWSTVLVVVTWFRGMLTQMTLTGAGS